MLEIVLTDNAKFTLECIFDSIAYKWGENIADDFMSKVEKTLTLTAKNPEIFKASPFKKSRIGIISKQTSFYYEVNERSLVVLHFWDNRQEPLF